MVNSEHEKRGFMGQVALHERKVTPSPDHAERRNPRHMSFVRPSSVAPHKIRTLHMAMRIDYGSMDNIYLGIPANLGSTCGYGVRGMACAPNVSAT